ncbi:bMERB domain-containing protein 1-like [Myxocyprinus asiaticus]|uniref:bMERB domain-containing protein 1-like n=1 Tax=Myxocyprinus asiaticus TaxID=70543 RepID=UPI0022219ED3|nr:bMERB domain-containing protein 1-like [Myxocyprinus asiaticus]
MDEKRRASCQYGSLESTKWKTDVDQTEADVVSMADSTITVGDIEGELLKIERIRDILIRRESELRYMMDDIQLCKEITRLKKELKMLLSIPDNDKSNEDKQKEEELLQQIHKLVEARDFLVDDVEFERLREREEDKEMAEFLKSKLSKCLQAKNTVRSGRRPPRAQPNSTPFVTKTGLTLLKECCGFTCSIM